MLEVFHLPRAEEDLIDIWRYIAHDSESAADRLLDRFADAAEKLAAHPDAGRPRPELAEGLRSLYVGNYVLFYTVTPPRLILVRILSRYLDIDDADFQP
jgi:toxin ParE1/3/4